jgi:hypothetical protein
VHLQKGATSANEKESRKQKKKFYTSVIARHGQIVTPREIRFNFFILPALVACPLASIAHPNSAKTFLLNAPDTHRSIEKQKKAKKKKKKKIIETQQKSTHLYFNLYDI